MPDYRYVAIDPQGRERKGRLTAANDDAARADLVRRKFHIVAVEAAGAKPASRSLLAFRRARLSSKELALFTRQLATLAEVAPLEEALRTLTRQSEAESARTIIGDVHAGLLEGRRLADAMARQPASFPPLYRAMVAAGETTGSLTTILARLADLLERLPRQLSGGQRQRVAMGRAIVRHPQAFLFDEPLSNLDAKLRVQMRIEIKSLHQQLGVTSVYVTHDQIEAMTMGDVIIVMNRGEVAQIGSPAEVYDAPADLFVAQFIGSPAMNLFAGAVEDGAFAGGEGLRLPCDAEPRGAVTCGVRPEALRLAPARGAGRPANGFHVRLIERTGPEYHVYGAIAGHEAVASVKSIAGLEVGRWAEASVSRRDLHLFDSGSGHRLPVPLAVLGAHA